MVGDGGVQVDKGGGMGIISLILTGMIGSGILFSEKLLKIRFFVNPWLELGPFAHTYLL